MAGVLEAVQQDGAAVIRNRDGQSFVVRPEGARKSVLDVEGIDLRVGTDEIVAAVAKVANATAEFVCGEPGYCDDG